MLYILQLAVDYSDFLALSFYLLAGMKLSQCTIWHMNLNIYVTVKLLI